MLIPQLLAARGPSGAPPARKAPAAGAPHPATPDGAAFDLALLRQEQSFDLAVKARAESEREANVLRELAMAQLKKDDENMKKWIALI